MESIVCVPVFERTQRGIRATGVTLESGTVSLGKLFRSKTWKLAIVPFFNVAKYTFIEYLAKSSVKYTPYTSFIALEDGRALVSYEDKFLSSFIDWKTANRYIAADEWGQKTATLDAKNQYLRSLTRTDSPIVGKNIHDLIFPDLPKGVAALCQKVKESCGSFVWLRKPGEYKDVWVYDRKAAFSAEARKKIPAGEPRYTDARPLSGWYIGKYYVRNPVPSSLDPLNFNNTIKEALSTHAPLFVFLTPETERIYRMFYGGVLEGKGWYVWKYRASPFAPMLDRNLHGDKSVKSYSKGRNNLLVGSLGTNPVRCKSTFTVLGDTLREDRMFETVPIPATLPAWLCIVGRAKLALLTSLQANESSVIYANTDSLFSTQPLDFSFINSAYDLCGFWECRKKFLRIFFKAVSHYGGETVNNDGVVAFDYRLAGSTLVSENIDYTAFVQGDYLSCTYVISNSGYPRPLYINHKKNSDP